MADENTKTLSRKEVTMLLKAWNEGDPLAPDKLAPLIYAELRRLAPKIDAPRESSTHSRNGSIDQ
jgi:hypothetical protein